MCDTYTTILHQIPKKCIVSNNCAIDNLTPIQAVYTNKPYFNFNLRGIPNDTFNIHNRIY